MSELIGGFFIGLVVGIIMSILLIEGSIFDDCKYLNKTRMFSHSFECNIHEHS